MTASSRCRPSFLTELPGRPWTDSRYNRRVPKITKREDGRYMMGLPTKGGLPRRFVYGRTEEEVLKNYERATSGNVYRRGSLSEFVHLHFRDWLQSRVTPTTMDRYGALWELHLGPDLGHYKFSELTPAILAASITKLTSGSSQSLARTVLRQMFELAIAHREADYALLSMLRTVKLKSKKSRARLNVGERADELLKNLEGHWVYGLIWTMATLGLRKGEACGLMASDLSADGILTIQRQRSHRKETGRLKKREEGEGRRVALPAALAERLRSFMAPEGYAFRDDHGEPVTYNHLDRVIAPFQPEDRLTIHDLRAAAVSRLVDAGVDDRTIMDIVGHVDPKMLSVYRDRRDERIRKAFGG